MKKKLSLIVKKLSCDRNEANIFKPLSFNLLEGQLLVIKGGNGKGKTTLLHCLAGVIPYKGSIAWSGNTNKIGYIGHKFGLKEHDTVEDFINFWKKIYKSDVNIKDVINYFSLSKLIYLPLAFLSFGQKKKLAFVRLFLLNNKVWLLDEPFSGMDKVNKTLIFEMIQVQLLNKGMVILSTHEKENKLNIKNAKELVIV